MTDTSASRDFHDPDPTLDDPVAAAWFNFLDQLAFEVLDGAETKAEVIAALGISDDDLTDYVRRDGTSVINGILSYASHPTFNADTQLVDKLFVDNAISGVGGITDHGEFTGLGDDDHTIYSLADGTRAFTGKVSYSAHPSFSADTELIDKKYADDKFAPILGGYVTESGTSFTLGSTHEGNVVLVNNASDITVTAPATGNSAGWNAVLIQTGAGQILLDDDGGQTAFSKPDTANLRSSEKHQPIWIHQDVVGTYRVSGGLEDASIKRMEVMVCGTDVDVEATDGFNGNAVVIPDEFDGMNLVDISVFNPGTAGSTGDSTYQLHNVTDAVNMLSTVATIEDGEVSTLTATTPPAINNANDDVAEGDILRLDPKTVGTTKPKGLIYILEFKRPA